MMQRVASEGRLPTSSCQTIVRRLLTRWQTSVGSRDWQMPTPLPLYLLAPPDLSDTPS